MVLFDIVNYFRENRQRQIGEVEEAKSMQDNIKEFNQQIPKDKEMENLLASFLSGLENEIGNLQASGESGMNNGFSGNTDKEKVWNFFRGKGFTKKATAGIIGNTDQESSTNPKAIQNGGKGPGTGLIQWGNGADGGRWNDLEKWANKNGKDKWAIETQLEWLWKEMNDNYHTRLLGRQLREYGYNPGNDVLAAYAKVDNIKHSVYIFDRAITRAGKPMFERRIQFAEKAYNEFKNYTGGGGNQTTGNFTNPAPGVITSPYGMRTHPVHRDRRMHKGIDVAGGGTALVAMLAGTITVNKFSNGWGNYIKINHGTVNGKKIETLYAHLAKRSHLSVGQQVNQGQNVGIMGTTGESTGVHLHFEVHENGNTVDPENYVKYNRR